MGKPAHCTRTGAPGRGFHNAVAFGAHPRYNAVHLGRANGSLAHSAIHPSPASASGCTAVPRRGLCEPFSFFWEAHMGKKLYVGGLPYGVTDRDLEEMCGAHGTVQSAQVIMDRDTGRSKGFGFVEMGSDQEAQAACAALNGKDMNGRT